MRITIYPKGKRHFRYRKTPVAGRLLYHPCYVLGESEGFYLSLLFTHSPPKGKGFVPISHGPDPKDERPSYMEGAVSTALKENHDPSPIEGFALMDVDEEKVDQILQTFLDGLTK